MFVYFEIINLRGSFFISFKDLDLEDCYDSDTSNLLNDFYIPVLSEAKEYYRAVGYFNSKSLSFAAKGIKQFILNNGKMKVLCGTSLSEEDVEAIVQGKEKAENIISKNFLDDINSLEDNIRLHHVQVLGWMIANDLLDIKIVLKLDDDGRPCINKEGILHFKIGIIKDMDGNYITINGSNNETPFGWGKNYEFFDVCKSWEPAHLSHFKGHLKIFNRTWNGEGTSYILMDVPEFAKQALIDRSPKDISGLLVPGEDPIPDKKPILKPELYDYQKDAINKWFENGKKGIFAMATGTGKTFTSLGCLERLLNEEEKLVTIISAPQMHLVQQWKESIFSFGLKDKFDDIIIVDSSNYKGKTQFKDAVYDIHNGLKNKILILTTHSSFSLPDFYCFLKKDNFDCHFLLIADEMHGLGSYKRQQGLIPQYTYHLGLSATPKRQYDDFGTNFLFDYFGDVVYEFSLKDALNKINPLTNLPYLTSYYYKPYFVRMNHEELKKFNRYSNNLVIEFNRKNPDKKKIESLMFKRANVIKNASNKYDVLRKILRDMENKNNLIIYCSEKQIDEVLEIAGNEFNLSVKTFTSKDNATPDITGESDRDKILKDFSSGIYDGLVAMHCLDEGVDIPSASRAILMCNSTNPREFIQRVGRVIRRSKNKSFADVYDMIIKPSKNSEFKETENDIFEKEKRRTDMIGSCASLISTFRFSPLLILIFPGPVEKNFCSTKSPQ